MITIGDYQADNRGNYVGIVIRFLVRTSKIKMALIREVEQSWAELILQ